MTTPAGYPIWSRASDPSYYGGRSDKRNYQDMPGINPRTDVDVEQFLRLCADIAALAKTAPFASLHIVTNDTTTAAPTVHGCRMLTGVYSGAPYAGDAPPTGFPTVAYVSDGVFDVTFAATYTDPYGVAGTSAVEFALASSGTASATVAAAVTSATTVRVTITDGTPQNRTVYLEVA